MSFLTDVIGGVVDRVYTGAHPAITIIGTGVGLLGFLVDRPLIIVGGIGFILIGRLAIYWLQWRRHRLPETEIRMAPHADAANALSGDAPTTGWRN